MGLARGWAWFVAPLVGVSLVLVLASWAHVGFAIGGLAAAALALLVAGFFRDPDREVGAGVVAPADGRIQHADPDRIVTFLNVHDVHVVRAPYAGRIERVERFEGGHRPAFLEGSKKNAGVRVELRTPEGLEEVRLVAGLVARRAVAWVEEGDRVEKGDRIGMIRFASRVDATLPPDAEPTVTVGDRVKAGASTVAKPRREEAKA